MVKAPEKFLNEYLSHEKGLERKVRTGTKLPKARLREFSDEERARLKQNLQILWDIYHTPEIKEILSRKHKIDFLDIENALVNVSLSYVDKGISMEYELDMGTKKELAGARIYKQGETLLNRYFTSEKGLEELLKTSNPVLQVIVNILIEKELSETDIWNTIAKGERIHLSTLSYFV